MVLFSVRKVFENASISDDIDVDPEVTPGLYQGDMALTDEVWV